MARGGSDGSVVIDTALDNRGFIRGIRGMTGQVDGLQAAVRRLGKTITTVFAVKAVVDFGKRAVQIGSDVAEVQNVVDTAFGELSGQAEEFAQTAITQFGMSALSAKKTASTYMAMAKNMGIASQEAADMAITLAGLSGDVASFFNISQELADVRLKSVFTGETETLKELGVVMTQDNLKAYALSKGFKKSYDAMSQAEKVALRYRFVLDSLALANGDFARTQDSWANQTRILSMQWQEFMGILGQSIITVLKPVVKWLNAVVSHMIALATLLNNTVTKAFGGETRQAEATSSAIASSVEEQEALTGAVKDTNKAQKKSLAGFDEITRLAGEAAESAGGVGGGGAVDVGSLAIPDLSELEDAEEPSFASWGEAFSAFLDLVLEGVPKLKTAFGDFADWLNEFSQKVYDMFTFPGVLEKVQQLGRDLADALNYLVAQIDWYQLGQALGAGLNLALQFLVSFLYSFDWIAWGGSLAALINGAVSEIDWYAVGQLLIVGWKIAIETLTGFLLGLDMAQLAQAASQLVIGYFNAMQETIANIDWSQIGAQIAEFLNNIDWAGIFSAVWGFISETIKAGFEFLSGVIANAGPELSLAIAAIAAGLGAKFATEFLPKIISVVGEIKRVFGKLSDVFTIAKNSVYTFSEACQMVFGPGSIIAGIAALIGGAVLAVTNFLSMLENGFNWANEALMLLGIAISAVGAIILGAPAMITGVVAAIVATVATLIVSSEDLRAAFSDAIERINGVFDSLAGKVKEVIEQHIAPLIEKAIEVFGKLFNTLKELWDNILEPFVTWVVDVAGKLIANELETIGNGFLILLETVVDVVSGLLEALGGVIDFIVGVFTGDWKKAWEGVKSIFSGIIDGIKSLFSGAIDFIKNLISGIVKDISDLVSSIASIGSGGSKGSVRNTGFTKRSSARTYSASLPETYSTQKLPRLARGAVIPPNREFLAVLGDQSSGTNIEAPVSEIESAVMRGIRAAGNLSGNRPITVILQLDRREFGRAVYQVNNEETQRVGVRLVEART